MEAIQPSLAEVAALAIRSFELGWISRIRDTRAVLVPEKGKRGLSETFGMTLAA
jgi:hypothetical protein